MRIVLSILSILLVIIGVFLPAVKMKFYLPYIDQFASMVLLYFRIYPLLSLLLIFLSILTLPFVFLKKTLAVVRVLSTISFLLFLYTVKDLLTGEMVKSVRHLFLDAYTIKPIIIPWIVISLGLAGEFFLNSEDS